MIQKVFVTKSGKANFLCPKCNKTTPMDVSKFKTIDKEVKLKCKCSCKHTFSVTLERRRHYRKTVDLIGELIVKNTKTPIKIIDVSRIGLKIVAKNELSLEIGTKAVVNFTLDDVSNSRVSKDVIIKSSHATTIGAAFLSHNHYDKFGNYILFQAR